jgi:hypothetical protein
MSENPKSGNLDLFNEFASATCEPRQAEAIPSELFGEIGKIAEFQSNLPVVLTVCLVGTSFALFQSSIILQAS